MRLLADRLLDPNLPAHRVVISPSLRVRESSAPPRAEANPMPPKRNALPRQNDDRRR